MEGLSLVLAGLAGVVLGCLYFGGLWFTIRRIPQVQQPELWVLASFVIRMAIVLAGFYLVMAGRWERIAVCLVGFVVARVVLTWMLRPRTATVATH